MQIRRFPLPPERSSGPGAGTGRRRRRRRLPSGRAASALPTVTAVKSGVTVLSNAKAAVDASNLVGGLCDGQVHRQKERAHQGADHQDRRHHLYVQPEQRREL